jgi:cytoplasmic tRNA 2-thiolation protein 1
MPLCGVCKKTSAQLKRPKTLELICKECFYDAFEKEVHETITQNKIFSKGLKT